MRCAGFVECVTGRWVVFNNSHNKHSSAFWIGTAVQPLPFNWSCIYSIGPTTYIIIRQILYVWRVTVWCHGHKPTYKKNCYWSVVDESYGYKIDDLYRKPVYIYKVGYDYFADINDAPKPWAPKIVGKRIEIDMSIGESAIISLSISTIEV